MRALLILASWMLATLLALPAHANIPVTDAAQLDRHSQTAGAGVKLVPLTGQRKVAGKGIKCSVTTGKQGSIRDPAGPAAAGAGVKMIQSFGPSMPASPGADARGVEFSGQTHFKTTGDVVGGLEASRASLAAAQAEFTSAGLQVGTAPTVMGAIDMNSAARVQNGLAWNGAITSANAWLTAINALNVAITSDESRAAIGMQMGGGGPSGTTNTRCQAGMTGSGTATDPCRSEAVCSTTPVGTTPDPACVSARLTDSNGNVLYYLARIQARANAAAAPAPSLPAFVPVNAGNARGPPITPANIPIALQSHNHQP